MTRSFACRFARELAFWSIHGALGALPGVIIGVLHGNLDGKPEAWAGMAAAFGTCLLACASFSVACPSLAIPEHIFTRALRAVLRIRGVIALISACLAIFKPGVYFAPDLWLGIGALVALDLAPPWLHLPQGYTREGNTDFLSIYAAGCVFGVVLLALIAIATLMAMIVIDGRDRREGRIPGTPGQ